MVASRAKERRAETLAVAAGLVLEAAKEEAAEAAMATAMVARLAMVAMLEN